MPLGKKRKRGKKSGLAGAAERRAKRTKLLEAQESGMEKFRKRRPEFAAALDDLREKAAEGYQIPKTDYEVGDHQEEIFELIAAAAEERKEILAELDEIFSVKSNSSRYLSLLKAASVPGYDGKALSKGAAIIRDAIRKKIPLEQFGDFRMSSGKTRRGIVPKKKR